MTFALYFNIRDCVAGVDDAYYDTTFAILQPTPPRF